MVDQIMERVELIVNVQGSRKIAMDDLEFMFEKYELKPEEREEVLKKCEEKHITVFSENAAPSVSEVIKENEEKIERLAKEGKKKGFLSKLFGR